MQSPLVVYLVVAGASVVAGVAIASGSESSSETPVIESASTDPSADSVTDADGGAPATNEPAVSEPDAAGSDDPDATDPDDDAASDEATSSTDTTSAPTTETDAATTTTTSPTTTSTTVPLADRSVFPIFVANGANVAGVAGLTGDRLSEFGYGQIRRGDASEFVDVSVVYAGAEVIPFGERLARDMGIDPALVLPLDDMPEVGGVNDELLVVYLGRDVVDLLLAPLPDL